MKKIILLSLALASAQGMANSIQTPFILPTGKVLPKGVRNLSYKGVTFPCFHGHYSKQQDSFLFYTPLGSHIQVKNAFALDCTNLYT